MLARMVELRFTPSSFTINDNPVEFSKTTPTQVTSFLGARAPRVVTGEHNDVTTWDRHGLHAYCAPGTGKVNTLSFLLDEGYRYRCDLNAKTTFAGRIAFGDAAFSLPEDAARYASHIKKEAAKIKKKFKDSVTLTIGPWSLHYAFDAAKKHVTSFDVALTDEEEQESDLPPIEPPKGEGVKFKDFNFKLMVIQTLMYDRKVLTPAFDVYEFAKRYKKRAIDIDEEGYEVIPEVRKYFANYPIPASLLGEIEKLEQDGGDDVYLQLRPFWDGEDDAFNVKKADDAALLPKLRRVVLFHDKSKTILQAFQKRRIEATFL